jgi:hypothetical protein
MDYIEAFHKQYVLQQGLYPSPENIREYSIDDGGLKLLYETPRYWIVLTSNEAEFLNVIWKEDENGETREMETIEL